jgi:DNA-binding MarR family transcriptional regulator
MRFAYASAGPVAGLISQRTRADVPVAKARGVRLGNPSPAQRKAEMAAAARQARSSFVADRVEDVLDVLRQVQTEGVSGLRAIAEKRSRAARLRRRQGPVVGGTGPAAVGPLRGCERLCERGLHHKKVDIAFGASAGSLHHDRAATALEPDTSHDYGIAMSSAPTLQTHTEPEITELHAQPQGFLSWCPKETLGYQLKRTLHAWSRRFDAALRPLGLTHLQFITLAAIIQMREAGEIPSQVRVAEWMHQDTMMLSKILRLLEERGYVARSAHPEDPRANALALTDAGLDVVVQSMPVVHAAHENFFGRLPAKERRALAGALSCLLESED